MHADFHSSLPFSQNSSVPACQMHIYAIMYKCARNKHLGQCESLNQEMSTPTAEPDVTTNRDRKRKVKKSAKISPSDSCFGATKELSEDGIGEFSDNSSDQEDGATEESNQQPRLEKYFSLSSSPSAVLETPSIDDEVMMKDVEGRGSVDEADGNLAATGANGSEGGSASKTTPTRKKKNTNTTSAFKRQKTNTQGKPPIPVVPRNQNSLEAAFLRAENIRRSSTAVVVDGIASMEVDVEKVETGKVVTSTGRQPMKTISDLFKNASSTVKR